LSRRAAASAAALSPGLLLLSVLLLCAGPGEPRGAEPPVDDTPAASPAPADPAPAAPAPDPAEPDRSAPSPPPVRSRKGFAVRITNPESNDFRFGRSEIDAEVTAADPALIEKVEFYVDDRLVFIDKEAPWRCMFDFGSEPRSWVLRSVAYHREGVTVSNTVILRRVYLNYSMRVDRVLLYATARQKGRYLASLKPEDLVLEEDGVRQRIIDFYLETRPVTLAMILDSSGSMQPSLPKVHDAASGFVGALGPEDRALVIDFDEKVYLLQDLTGDKDALRTAIVSTNALGGTALFDSLYASYRKLKGIDGRKAIILLTDGDDTASRFSFKRVLDGAKLSDIIIYSIGLGTSVLDVDLRRILKSLAEESGGRAFFPDKVDELRDVYADIANELKSQYYITYEPTNGDYNGRWRKIKLAPAPGRDFEVRTRSGYYGVRRPLP
jgi:VWFA-related protein